MNKNLKRLGALAVALASLLSLMVIPSHAAVFSDVPQTFWGYEEINRMSALGYVKGYEDGTFKPGGKITAIETLMLCARATGIDSGTQVKIARDRKSEVEDILPKTNNMNIWAASEMAVALETGILSASELKELSRVDPASRDGRTYLEETISRENICMYLTRAMQLEPLAKSLSNTPLGYKYKDAAQISAAPLPYAYVLTNYGVVKGKETGNFDPRGAVTRAEMATMLCRALDAMEELGIVTDLIKYADYRWVTGVITSIIPAQNADADFIITIWNDFSELSQSFYVPATAKIYKDNMLTSSHALRDNQYVRLNLDDSSDVTSIRIDDATRYTDFPNEPEENPPPPAEIPSASTVSVDYFTAYAEKLCEIMIEHYNAFACGELLCDLIYLDNDNIPELIVGNPGYYISIYTFSDGQVYQIANELGYGVGGNHGYDYVPYSNVIYSMSAEYAGTITYESYFKINRNHKIEDYNDGALCTWYFIDQNNNGFPDGDEAYDPDAARYFVNEREIEKAEYFVPQVSGEYQLIEPTKSMNEVLGSLYRDGYVQKSGQSDAQIVSRLCTTDVLEGWRYIYGKTFNDSGDMTGIAESDFQFSADGTCVLVYGWYCSEPAFVDRGSYQMENGCITLSLTTREYLYVGETYTEIEEFSTPKVFSYQVIPLKNAIIFVQTSQEGIYQEHGPGSVLAWLKLQS